MCLIVQLPNKEAKISEADLASALARNHDGLGVVYATYDKQARRKKLVVAYELGTLKEQHTFFRKHEALASGGFAAHLRMATDGIVNEHNCHPHPITLKANGDKKDIYLLHNGILSGYTTGSQAVESDTVKFIREVMTPQLKKYPNLLKNVAWRSMVEETIGSTNKLLIIEGGGKMYRFNGEKGIFREGAWLSNAYSVTGDGGGGEVTRLMNHPDTGVWGSYTWNNKEKDWVKKPTPPVYRAPLKRIAGTNGTTNGFNTGTDTVEERKAKSNLRRLKRLHKLAAEIYALNEDYTEAGLVKYEELLVSYRVTKKPGDPTSAALVAHLEQEAAHRDEFLTDEELENLCTLEDPGVLLNMYNAVVTGSISTVTSMICDDPDMYASIYYSELDKSTRGSLSNETLEFYADTEQSAVLIKALLGG